MVYEYLGKGVSIRERREIGYEGGDEVYRYIEIEVSKIYESYIDKGMLIRVEDIEGGAWVNLWSMSYEWREIFRGRLMDEIWREVGSIEEGLEWVRELLYKYRDDIIKLGNSEDIGI